MSGLANSWVNAEKSENSFAQTHSPLDGTLSQRLPRTSTGTSVNGFRSISQESGLRSTPSHQQYINPDRSTSAVPQNPDVWARNFRKEGEDLSYQSDRVPSLFKPTIQPEQVTHDPSQDGAAVVTLLNSPTTLFNTDSLQHDLNATDQDAITTAADLFSTEDLDNSERTSAQTLRDFSHKLSHEQTPHISTTDFAPQPASSHSRPTSSSSKQLHPNTELLHLPLSTSPTATRRLSITSNSSVAYFSSHAEREAWYKQWLDEWDDVLSNYQREVWGYEGMDFEGARVEEAREEVQKVKERERKGEEWWEDRGAVRRLRLVLGHLGLGEGADAEGVIEEEGNGTAQDPDLEGAWRRRKGKEKLRSSLLPPEGEPLFRCPDCGGVYGAEEHMGMHKQWAQTRGARENGEDGKIGEHFRRQVVAVECVR